MTKTPRLIVGVGSHHGDDRAGWLAAERLAAMLAPEIAEVRVASSPAQLLDWIDSDRRLLVCDACRGLGTVGEVRHWQWPCDALADAHWSGTHDLPLPAVLQLADRLDRLPKQIDIWTVEGNPADAMAPMSGPIHQAVGRLVLAVAAKIEEDHQQEMTPCTRDRW